eukprot:TRINITY_DN2606_c0_g2_i1.p2 TRINITY_DN2606_c0_g2~~TRINITY_DN2606_c0_g2_i1.p2  ORF type:complete len:201 (+),score=10.89 TRINITY_DN2606_c0_g2_i1:496-1098(+)
MTSPEPHKTRERYQSQTQANLSTACVQFFNTSQQKSKMSDAWRQRFESGQPLRVEELHRALLGEGLEFSLAQVAFMIRVHDGDGDGKLTYSEFLSLRQSLRNWEEQFRRHDRDEDGRLTRDEVQQAMFTENNLAFQNTILTTIFDHFDPDGTKNLSFDEYIRMQLFLCGAQKTFAQADGRSTGRVQFDFSGFVGAVSNCR